MHVWCLTKVCVVYGIMYVCVYVCRYIYIYMYVCMYVGMCVYVCTYVRTYLCMCVCMYVCTYVRVYVCVYVCMHVGFKTLFYVVRHLDSTPSYLPIGLHLGFFRSCPSLYLPSSFSSVFLVLPFVSGSTSSVWDHTRPKWTILELRRQYRC